MLSRELRESLFISLLVTPSYFAFILHNAFYFESVESYLVKYELSNQIRWSFQAALNEANYIDSDGSEAEDFRPIDIDGKMDNMFKMISNNDLSEVEEMRRVSSNDDTDAVDPSGSLMEQLSSEKLEDLVDKMKSIIFEKEGPDALKDTLKDDGDAPFLEPEAYTNFRDNLNVDGSLSQQSRNDSLFNSNDKPLVNDRLNLPDSYFTTNVTATSDASLLEKIFESKPKSVDDVDEDLHQQIMSGEEAFQKQSKEFQEFLKGETSEKAQEAAFMARQKLIADQQRNAIDRLENEMLEFEQKLDEKESKKLEKTALCPECNLPLSQNEIDAGNRGRMCRICLANKIASKSNVSFSQGRRENDTTNSAHKSYRNDSLKPSRPFTRIPSRSYERKMSRSSIENASSSSASLKTPSQKRDPSNLFPGKDEVKNLRMRILALQQQLQKYRRNIEVLQREKLAEEEENIRLRHQISQLEKGLLDSKNEKENENENENENDNEASWVEVTDPDTGETFFWNEDTEEMKWEM
mmetsp:Transcript_16395/g.24800  ORF Transcript_16395/g.24800 Transcript_16395/m.24800 type:complete len:523 (+) Transcript_16395:106-1674(+)